MRLLERFEIFKGSILTESCRLASGEGWGWFHVETGRCNQVIFFGKERKGSDENKYRRLPCSGGEKIKLEKWPTRVQPLYESKKIYKELLNKQRKELSAQQQLHYAANRYAVLLIFQAMDAAGKDGAIRHVMSGVNPQGCEVFNFQQPSAEELKHDFLWRTNQCLPERGRIGIFNRSYYEEVLIVRVHPELLQAQGIPPELSNDRTIWQERYRSIMDMEKHLHRNGTRIINSFCTFRQKNSL